MNTTQEPSEGAIDHESFKQALRRWPSGVTITTTQTAGTSWGFTASAFSSLSLDPPLILVCLAKSADCFDAFATSEAFAVNMLGVDHEELALRFASKGADKFSGGEFTTSPRGLPVLQDAAAVIECATEAVHDAGDHVILVGAVRSAGYGDDAEPMVYHAGRFARLT